METTVQTGIGVAPLKALPIKETAKLLARACDESGVVDDILTWDCYTSWLPRVLWTPENIPAASTIPDIDSWWDAFQFCAFVAAASDRLGVTLGGTNASRRQPAELWQTACTLADATNGRMICAIGAGEGYNVIPFGYDRAQGVDRLEDCFRIFQLLWERDEPFDFDGNHYHWKGAWLGGIRGHKPQFWGLGGGAKLLDITAKYADGWMSAAPFNFPDVDRFATAVKAMKEKVERHGRDPEKFRFGLEIVAFIGDDPDDLDRIFDNPAVRFTAGSAGRATQSHWEREGFERVVPAPWQYVRDMLPAVMTLDECAAIIDKTPRAMAEKFCFCGSPKDLAATIQPFVDAGASYISILDCGPQFCGTVGLEGAAQYLSNLIDVCRILKSEDREMVHGAAAGRDGSSAVGQ